MFESFSESSNISKLKDLNVWKWSKYGVFSGPNAGKYGPEKTRYLGTFHAVLFKVLNFNFSFKLL